MVAPLDTGALQRMLGKARGGISPDVAREVLSWRFDDADQARVAELSAKARIGSLSPDEARQLDWFLLLGDFLMILQSSARTSLPKTPNAV